MEFISIIDLKEKQLNEITLTDNIVMATEDFSAPDSTFRIKYSTFKDLITETLNSSNVVLKTSKQALINGGALTLNGNILSLNKADSTSDTIDLALDTYVTKTSSQTLSDTNVLNLTGNILSLNKGDGTADTIDLGLYLDDTNLSRIIKGTYDINTNALIFTRDDGSTFSVDASMFFDDTNLVTSVNNMTGNIIITKDTIGLGNVDNTSDLNKPLSTASVDALALKSYVGHTHDLDYAAIVHSHPEYSLTTHIHTEYSLRDHVHTEYSLTTHNHDLDYSAIAHTHNEYALVSHSHNADYSPIGHTHNQYSLTTHNHDLYYSVITHTHTDYSLTTHTHTEYLTSADLPTVIDNLTSTSIVDTLSANQGRILKNDIDNQISTHTHTNIDALYLNSKTSDEYVQTTPTNRQTITTGLVISDNRNDIGVLKVIQHKNNINAPASFLIAQDGDNDTDVAFEIRSKIDGTLTDTSDRLSNDTSPDMKLQIFSNGDIITSGSVTSNGNELLHAGNIGTLSLDADTVDGLHASSFSLTTHNHDLDYSAIGHTHTEYSLTTHTHNEYSLTTHTHTEYLTSADLPTVIDNLTSTSIVDALSANQGRILKNDIDTHTHNEYSLTTHTHTEYLTSADIINVTDNLTSTSIVDALSANQGRILKNDIDNQISTHTHNEYSLTTHTHTEYLTSADLPTVIDNLTSTSIVDALSANQGRILKNDIDTHTHNEYSLTTHTHTEYLTSADIINVTDNLTSTSIVDALSANQGRILKNDIDTHTHTEFTNMMHTNVAQTMTAPLTVKEVTNQEFLLTGTNINPANGSIQYSTISTSITFTESIQNGQGVLLMLKNSSVNNLITWPNVMWLNTSQVAPDVINSTIFTAIYLFKVNNVLHGLLLGDGT